MQYEYHVLGATSMRDTVTFCRGTSQGRIWTSKGAKVLKRRQQFCEIAKEYLDTRYQILQNFLVFQMQSFGKTNYSMRYFQNPIINSNFHNFQLSRIEQTFFFNLGALCAYHECTNSKAVLLRIDFIRIGNTKDFPTYLQKQI